MNQKLFLIILTMLLNLFAGCTHAKPVPDSPIAFMEYRVDNATRYPTLHFILRRDDDGRYWLTNASNCDPELAHAIEVPASFAEQLKQIVVEERMLAYKEHYISWLHRHVCGGDMWRFNLSLEDSTSVASSGYMKYPKGNGLYRVKQLCRAAWDSRIH